MNRTSGNKLTFGIVVYLVLLFLGGLGCIWVELTRSADFYATRVGLFCGGAMMVILAVMSFSAFLKGKPNAAPLAIAGDWTFALMTLFWVLTTFGFEFSTGPIVLLSGLFAWCTLWWIYLRRFRSAGSGASKAAWLLIICMMAFFCVLALLRSSEVRTYKAKVAAAQAAERAHMAQLIAEQQYEEAIEELENIEVEDDEVGEITEPEVIKPKEDAPEATSGWRTVEFPGALVELPAGWTYKYLPAPGYMKEYAVYGDGGIFLELHTNVPDMDYVKYILNEEVSRLNHDPSVKTFRRTKDEIIPNGATELEHLVYLILYTDGMIDELEYVFIRDLQTGRQACIITDYDDDRIAEMALRLRIR